MYDDGWHPGPDLPSELPANTTSYAICPLTDRQVESKFVLIGGLEGHSTSPADLNSVYVHDWETGQWTRQANAFPLYTGK